MSAEWVPSRCTFSWWVGQVGYEAGVVLSCRVYA